MNIRAPGGFALVGCLLISAASAQTTPPAPAAPAVPGAAIPHATVVAPAVPERGVATLQDVRGTVLVSRGDGMVAGTPNQRLPAGARVVTTAGSQATVNFDRGCAVRLVENQRFTVRDSSDCAALAAAVETTVLPATASSGNGNFAGAAAVVGLGVIGAALWDRNRNGGGEASVNAAAGGTSVSPE